MLSRLELSKRFPVFGNIRSSSLPIHGSHRGGRNWGKENTFEIYRRAVNEALTDILEIDIWKTNDEHLVLNHDGVISGLNVNQSTYEQLQAADPLLVKLDQFLTEFTPVLSLAFFFDMKDVEAIPLTLDLIKQYEIENRVIFGAVDRTINKEIQRQKGSSIPICADIETMMKISQDYKQGKLNENYPYEHDILGFFVEPHTRSMINDHLIDTIHKGGKPLALVGSLLDDPKVQQEMIELGIDILFTDRPDILRKTFDSFQNK